MVLEEDLEEARESIELLLEPSSAVEEASVIEGVEPKPAKVRKYKKKCSRIKSTEKKRKERKLEGSLTYDDDPN